MDLEPVVPQVDREGSHLSCDLAILPPVENPACVGSERDDVAEDFEFQEGLVDGDGVALSVAFDCGDETAET